MFICGMYAHSCIDRRSAAYMQSQVEAEHRREHAQACLMHVGTDARAYNHFSLRLRLKVFTSYLWVDDDRVV